MAMPTRAGISDTLAYVQAVKEEDYTLPSEAALRTISDLVDQKIHFFCAEMQDFLKRTPEFQTAVQALKTEERLCGGFTSEKAVLKDFSSYEQMAAVAEWVDENGQNMEEQHNLALAAPNGEVVPLWVKPRKKTPTLMNVMLGTTRGRLKGPKYTEWAENDPRQTDLALFIEPLNALEMQRQLRASRILKQPSRMGALDLKANSYKRGPLPNTWRYRVYDGEENFAKEASVELPHQGKRPSRLIKEQSAGYNLARMMQDPKLRDENILPKLFFKNYSSETARKKIPVVTPASIVKTLPKVLSGQNEEPFSQKMNLLFAARVGVPKIPLVKQFTAQRLFPT